MTESSGLLMLKAVSTYLYVKERCIRNSDGLVRSGVQAIEFSRRATSGLCHRKAHVKEIADGFVAAAFR